MNQTKRKKALHTQFISLPNSLFRATIAHVVVLQILSWHNIDPFTQIKSLLIQQLIYLSSYKLCSLLKVVHQIWEGNWPFEGESKKFSSWATGVSALLAIKQHIQRPPLFKCVATCRSH